MHAQAFHACLVARFMRTRTCARTYNTHMSTFESEQASYSFIDPGSVGKLDELQARGALTREPSFSESEGTCVRKSHPLCPVVNQSAPGPCYEDVSMSRCKCVSRGCPR